MDDSMRMRLTVRTHIWRPPTDVYEVDDSLVVRMEVAGMLDVDFSIVLDGRLLSIRGARPDSPEKRAYYQMEIPFGEFGIDIDLPYAVDSSQIEAVYANGFLRILLPKMRPHKVSIEE